jgi:hypothetical protein
MLDDVLTDADLAVLSLPAAMRAAVAFSGLSDAQISARMGWKESQGYRILNPSDDYWCGLPQLPKLCAVLGNDILPRWVIIRAKSATYFSADTLDKERLVLDLAALFARCGQVGVRGDEAIQDGIINTQEAKKIRRAVEEVVRICSAMLGRLAIAAKE